MKDGYLDFDEYIRQGEPAQRERAEAWSVAIGLQAVDGLQVSDYLLELARRNIEGEITIDEVIELLNERDAKKSRLKEYTSYTRVDAVDPIESKMGRPFKRKANSIMPYFNESQLEMSIVTLLQENKYINVIEI